MKNKWALALAAMVGVASAAFAQEESAIPQESQTNETEAADPSPLLTGVLGKTGVGKFLEAGGVQIGGYVQGSWTYNTSSPSTAEINGRSFDFENQDLTLNGANLTIRREADAKGKSFDLGFRLDLLYGSDARFTKSNGLLDNRGFVFAATADGDTGPNEQFDIPQAFIQLALPIGGGLEINVGKFITPIGFEYVDPTKNTLYSHSYLFAYAGPYSQTGVTANYHVNEKLSVLAGITRGWDQSLEDTNSHVDLLARVDYKFSKQWEATLTLSTGPQQPDGGEGYLTLLDGLLYFVPNDAWSVGLEATYGIEADVPGTGQNYSQFYGIAAYPSYKLNKQLSINGRAEWFSDADGNRGVGADNVYEATLGVTWAPLAGQGTLGEVLRIRPEIRLDYADNAVFDGQHSQTTFAVDAVLAF